MKSFKCNSAPGWIIESFAQATMNIGDIIEHRAVLRADWRNLVGVSVNGAAEIVSALSGAGSAITAFSDTKVYFGSMSTGVTGLNDFTHVCLAAGDRSLAEIRELAGV